MPSLSVIIPTKNEAQYLPRLLEDLKMQTLQPESVIVADAGSTDGTREIAERFGAKVVEGGMPGPGRNAGASAAHTDLLLFLDADMLLPDAFFLEKMVGEAVGAKLDIGTVDVVLFQGSWGDKMLHRVYNAYVRLVRPFIVHAPGSCILVRKSMHDKIQGFDPTVLFCEDHDYANRARKAGAKFGFMNSTRIGATVRRQDRDGRLRLTMTYILAELHLWFLGPIRHNGFKYGFGYGEKKGK